MTNLFEKAIENLKEAWSSVVDIDPILTDLEVNPQFLQMVSPNETVVVISLNTTIGETSGMINICIPHVVLEPMIPKLSVHYWMQTSKKAREPEEIKAIENRLKHAKLEVTAQLGKSSITVNEFLNLSVGDVIQLDQKIDEPLVINIANNPKFLGQPGNKSKKMAVQVIEKIKGGEDDGE